MRVLLSSFLSISLLLSISAIGFSQCNPGDPDADADGVCDALDVCPGSDDLIDFDQDGIPFGCDNCVDFNQNEDCDVDETEVFVYFSHHRGFYEQNFQLQLSSNHSNAVIKYTLDGTDPVGNGTTYAGSISITTTTPVRAVATSGADQSKTLSNTYIYTADVVNQPTSVSGFPAIGLGMSTTITGNSTWGPQMEDALKSIGTVCVNLDVADFNLVYNNRGLEKPISFEYFDDQLSVGAPAGTSSYGNGAWNTKKKNYRIKFKESLGLGKLEAPMFGEEATQKFDVFDLRGGNQQTFIRGGVQNLHENFFKELQIKMSGFGPHTFFAHLYFNGVYWGVYCGSERPAKFFGEAYFGGDDDDYNTIKSACCVQTPVAIDGTSTTYSALPGHAANYSTINQYLDIYNYINYVLICNFGPHGDWTPWNTYAIDNPTAGVPYRFFMWDPEPSLNTPSGYFTNVISGTTSYFQNIWNPLHNQVDFRVDFSDNVQCKCVEEDGPLTPANATQHYLDIYNENNLAYLMEAAKWRNLTNYQAFINYKNDLIATDWIGNRISDMLIAHQNNEVYSTTKAVDFNIEGGAITSVDQLCLSHTNSSGTMYFTMDGSDPRLPGGAINPAALIYNGCITLSPGAHTIRARVLHGSQSNNFHKWSPMCPKEFYVDQQYTGLVINEIHYNPSDSITSSNDTIAGTSFEFIEIKNNGTNSIDLKNVTISKGVLFKFANSLNLAAGDFAVVAEDSLQFISKYGFSPDGQFRGKLDNKGETLHLYDPLDNLLDDLTYDDDPDWPKMADRGTMSLALLDAQLDNSIADNWDVQSCSISPGAENEFGLNEIASGIRINEIHYHPLDSIGQGAVIDDVVFEFIELHNNSNSSIDLSRYFFAKGIEYSFPAATVMPANSYLVLAKDAAFFTDRFNLVPFAEYEGRLSNSGEMIWLMNANGKLVDYVDYKDDSPWPQDADGTGMSLAFKEDDFTDNSLGANWDVQSETVTPNEENIFTTCKQDNFIAPPSGLTSQVDFNSGLVTISWTPYEFSTACMIRAWYASLPANKIVLFVGSLATPQSPSQLAIPITSVNPGVNYEWDVICGCSLDPLTATTFSSPSPFLLNYSPP